MTFEETTKILSKTAGLRIVIAQNRQTSEISEAIAAFLQNI